MRIISLLLLFSLSIFCNAQLSEISTQQLSKTKVSSITIMGYVLDKYGAPSKVGSKKEYSKYDLLGNQTKLITYNAQSAIINNSTFIYKNGKRIKTLTKDNKDQTIFFKGCDINNKGLYKNCKGKRNNKTFSYSYTYDKKGRLLSKTKLGEAQEIIHTFKFIYKENSQIINEVYQGIRKVETNFTYNEKGFLKKKVVFSNDQPSHTIEFTYNDDNDLVQEVKYNAQSIVIEQFRYTYFEKGKISSVKKYNRTNQLEKTWKYTYNDKWNIDTIKILEGEKSTPLYMSQYLYKYHAIRK